jgi:hypothetical protein
MCSRDDDPTQHDIERPDSLATYDRLLNIQPPIDWQANIDAAVADVRAMSEALVFAKAEITRLRREAEWNVNDAMNENIEQYTLTVTLPLKEEITFLRSVLTQIAEEDYRGNEPWERQLAKRALREYSGAVE